MLAGSEAGQEFMPAFWEQVSPDPSFEEMEAVVCAPRSERPPLDSPRFMRDPVRFFFGHVTRTCFLSDFDCLRCCRTRILAAAASAAVAAFCRFPLCCARAN